ncbi:ATPase [Artemisia annua]|uniref:ATPase n=1 Tax=Artemisia annua TaxID=35608 RepID=A0A2U1PG87_ARTAN|nr:ATPase [Artemisia annua]
MVPFILGSRQTDSADTWRSLFRLPSSVNSESVFNLCLPFMATSAPQCVTNLIQAVAMRAVWRFFTIPFGFCVQFLPNVMEQLASNRKTIEAELNELLKLCKWNRNEWYMTVETSKRTCEKFKKLIQKYTDVLKQPVMLIFTEEAARRGINTMANHILDSVFDDFNDAKRVPFLEEFIQTSIIGEFRKRLQLVFAFHGYISTAMRHESNSSVMEQLASNRKTIEAELNELLKLCKWNRNEWFIWSPTWRNKVDLAMEDMRLASTSKPEKKRSAAKNMAYLDLLKLLDDCGLAKHRSWFIEDRWYLQPSYSMEHLLLKEGRFASGKLEVAALENLQPDWKTANEHFFKSLHSLGHLRDICSKSHQDFELEKDIDDFTKGCEDGTYSVWNELESDVRTMVMEAVCGLAEAFSVETIAKSTTTKPTHESPIVQVESLSHNQDIVFNCMLRQKQLFDTMCSTLNDECLLLSSVKNNHVTCESVGAGASLMVQLYPPGHAWVHILIVVLKTSDRLSLASPEFGFDDEAVGCHARDMHKTGTPFVITSALKKSFEMLMLFASQRCPVLLYGPAGADKTALISRLAQGHGSQVCFFLTNLTVLHECSQIVKKLKDAHLVEEFIATEKKLSCLRLLKKFSPETFAPKSHGGGDDDLGTKQHLKLVKRGQVTDQLMELPIEQMIWLRQKYLVTASVKYVFEHLYCCKQVYKRLGITINGNPRNLEMVSRFGMHIDSESHNRGVAHRIWTSGNYNKKASNTPLDNSEDIIEENLPTPLQVGQLMLTHNIQDTDDQPPKVDDEASVEVNLNATPLDSRSINNPQCHPNYIILDAEEVPVVNVNPVENNVSLETTSSASPAKRIRRSSLIYPCIGHT